MNLFKLILCLWFFFRAVCVYADSQGYAQVTKDGYGAIASVNPLATQAGLNAFADGGNAVDAALAVAFTLGVVDGHNSGIGGGCFILVRTANGEVLAIDGREEAPALAHRDMFLKDGKVQPEWSKSGSLAIGIPGSVAALDALQRQAGKLKLKDVILPAAGVAEQGFAVDQVFAARLARVADTVKQYPATAQVYFDKQGEPLKAGDRLIQKDLAKTYRKIGKHGPDYFYQGKFAKAVDRWMKKNNGLVRYDDFKNYHIIMRQPIQSQFHEYTIYGFPPPSSGGVHIAQMLNILQNYDFARLDEINRTHLLIETMKLAFADRAYWLGDPAFAKVPKGLMAKTYADELSKKITLDKVSIVEKHGMPPKFDTDIFNKHTTHIATADKDGNWVAITTTVNTSFGSKVIIPGTGVVMNNQMDDFSALPGVPNAFGLVGAEANAVQPGKRPLSSMSPTLVLKGDKPVLTLGAAGGPTIITQVLQVIVKQLALGMPLEESMSSVRVHHQWKPDTLLIDGFASDELKQGLKKKGHAMRDWPGFGATQAISWDEDKGFTAVAEPRLIERNNQE
ncbi:gamma-glutamyltransferase [Teredinibacter sp. KSP-S5-2]|uniref:gamma-glutamyltransferase n=1 Tax=Teredinibacter sp. KSP-S5-2 TaxID=3034506 RepID=UPI00293432D3|nr:gamma-glutamyltransferase [Teredinibacter sp. KSP-S5-2]WNO10087.1 gamma-glutamyltransferase [Teredinibacter sp. KSP-S5-2]